MQTMTLKKRSLGGSGLQVSPLAFGCNVFGWTVTDATAFALLDTFVAAGFNLLDTADVYSRWVPGNHGGESETVIGKWLKRSGKRDSIVIATKVGMEMAPDRKGLSRAYILRSAEESLRRLQTDFIDLYQAHKDDPDTPIEETLEAFAELIQQGKVRAIGASNFGADWLVQSLQASRQRGLPRYESLQPLYNLFSRSEYETQLEPVCLKERLSVIPYYSLAAGFLTGKYRSEADLAQSKRGAGVKKYLSDRGMRILAALDQVAKEKHATLAQVALAWLIARPSITAPIASATSTAQLNELLGAATLQLDNDSVTLLDRASAEG